MRGLASRPRPSATICCCPPDSNPAFCRRRSFSIGNSCQTGPCRSRPCGRLPSRDEGFLPPSARNNRLPSAPWRYRWRQYAGVGSAGRGLARHVAFTRSACPMIAFSNVDLPAPLAPMMETISLGITKYRPRAPPGTRQKTDRRREQRHRVGREWGRASSLLSVPYTPLYPHIGEHVMRCARRQDTAAGEHTTEARHQTQQGLNDVLDPYDGDATGMDLTDRGDESFGFRARSGPAISSSRSSRGLTARRFRQFELFHIEQPQSPGADLRPLQ